MEFVFAFVLSLIAAWLAYPVLIPFLKKIKYGQSVSSYSLDDYKKKEGTPTMGGIAFVLIPIITLFIISPSFFKDIKVLLVVAAYLCYGLIGFVDDYIIVVKHDNAGLSAWTKLFLELVLSIVFFLIYKQYSVETITIPFVNWVIDLGFFYAFLVFFMFTGASNAVNLTDGMDGLAGGLMLIATAPFIYLALKQRETQVAIFLAAIAGSLLGYLRYNVHPARIFMGDTGSLALGGLLAALGLVLKQEIALVIIGGVFVYETLCVVIQIGSVKLRGKKVFKYTPIHYSFVLNGMSETRVVRLFWIFGLICALLGFLIGGLS